MAALGGDGLRLLSVSGPEPEPESAALNGAGPGLCCWVSVCSCLSLACSYVGSLYVWKSELPRHIPVHSDGLQAGGHLPRRVAAAAADHDPVPGPPDAALRGLSLGLGQRAESGPGPPGLGTMPDGHALATEPGDRPPDGGAGVPGLHAAHAGPLHGPGPCHLHLPPLLRCRVGSIFLSAAFQFSYTAVFGAYTAFLFIRTGHLIGPVLCHSFCNYMGFPAVCAALEHPQRCPLLVGYALGVGLFLLLLQPLTEPRLYSSLPLCLLLDRTGASATSLCS
ncbi:CAAX prenyl protease 2 isoform X4 [Phascolarctos cinereus]